MQRQPRGLANVFCSTPHAWLFAPAADTLTCFHASATEYVSQLAWYDSLLRADDYVLGATIFQLDCPGWGPYSLAYDDATSQLVAYMNGVSATRRR